MPEPQPTNRLIHESSPYLLQHAHNPVDWYPWGDEAFRKAIEEDKPLLLSCGYSACHWCHVMERESFENPEIADLMNRYFVNIKVDREERPDIDQIYQDAVHAMGIQGGWPLTVFLDHQRRPFYGGTYFPPHTKFGRTGFPEVLEAVHRRWSEGREALAEVSGELAGYLKREPGPDLTATGVPEPDLPVRALLQLGQYFDPEHGGFDGAPKFPNPGLLQLFLRAGVSARMAEAVERVIFSLEKMARGGIHDQIGGGFHRYSTDERWLVPHFEKMLYDNAQLLRIYANGYQLTKSAEFRRVIRETAAYVRREMTSAEGGFFATQDADSEGEEGKYYVWTPEAIRDAIGLEPARLIIDYYGVSREGNFEGANILNRMAPPSGIFVGQADDPRLYARLDQARAALLEARERRVKPFRDEKIITSWNGLMIGGLAAAYQALGDEDDYRTARRAAEFIQNRSRLDDGGLARVFKDDRARIPGFLDDYSFLGQGLLRLYECDFNPEWLRQGIALTEEAVERFGDGAGRYYLTARDGDLMHRPVSGNDQAIPSGVSIQAENLLKLASFTGVERYRDEAERILSAYGPAMAENVWGYAELLGALDGWHRGYGTFSFIAPGAGTPELLRKLRGEYLPYRVLALARDGEDLSDHPAREILADRHPVGGKTACYACLQWQCRPPVTGWEELKASLVTELAVRA